MAEQAVDPAVKSQDLRLSMCRKNKVNNVQLMAETLICPRVISPIIYADAVRRLIDRQYLGIIFCGDAMTGKLVNCNMHSTW